MKVASSDDAIKWGCDSGFLQFKLQRPERLLRNSKVLSLALYLKLGCIVLVFRLLLLGLGDNVCGPQLLRTVALRLRHLCARFPVLKIRFGASRFGGGSILV